MSWQLFGLSNGVSPLYLFRSLVGSPFQVDSCVGSNRGGNSENISLMEKTILVKRGEALSH